MNTKDTNKATYSFQEIIVFALAPIIVGLLTLGAWLFKHFEVFNPYLYIVLAVLATIFGGYQRFRAGFRDAFKRKITVNVFVTFAIIVTVAVGEFLPAAVIILIMAVVGSLEAYTLDKTRKSISGLLDLTPAKANVKQGDIEISVEVSKLQTGDVVVVRPGERIPVDGIVIAGSASVNQAPITGESIPVEKFKGNEVFAGTLNESGRLEIQTSKVGKETTLAKIVHLVEEAQESKAPIQTVADRFTTWFFPIVIGLAVIGYFLSGEIKVAVAILLVACPCAFAIATPSAVAAGIANMARRAVLIKGGVFFEIAGKINCLVVDKTGTLTIGHPKVMNIIGLNGLSEAEVLKLAAIGEKYSEHPLAKAILIIARSQSIEIPDPDDFKSEVGKGIEASYNGQKILIGKEDLLKEHNIIISQAVQEKITQQSDLGRTTILIANNNEIVGIISIADEVRPETIHSISSLKNLGIKNIVMLTGDHHKVAKAVAEQIGIEDYKAELLPHDKQAAIKALKNEGRIVAMVGDGINDAPALALADVGIVMGGTGSDIAIEAADVTLMDGSFARLVEFIQISRKVLRRIKLNIFFSIIYNVIGLVLALLGYLTPVMAVIFQEAGCVTVVVSSTLLLWAKISEQKRL